MFMILTGDQRECYSVEERFEAGGWSLVLTSADREGWSLQVCMDYAELSRAMDRVSVAKHQIIKDLELLLKESQQALGRAKQSSS